MSQTTITDIGTVESGQRPGQGGGVLRRHARLREAARRADGGELPLVTSRPGASTSVALIAGLTLGLTPASGSWFPTPKPSTPPCGSGSSRSGTCSGGQVSRPCSSSRTQTESFEIVESA